MRMYLPFYGLVNFFKGAAFFLLLFGALGILGISIVALLDIAGIIQLGTR
jgi:hypothetical protein